MILEYYCDRCKERIPDYWDKRRRSKYDISSISKEFCIKCIESLDNWYKYPFITYTKINS